MNLHHLSLFHAIAETGNISEASKRLFISQPALSKQLREFEARLNVVLFERHARGMRLTHAGEILRDYASRLFAIEQAAEAAMRDVADVNQGRLHVGASNTIGTYLLPGILANFRQRHPHIDVSLFVGNTEQVSRGVTELRFPIGFIEGPLHHDDLACKGFMQDEIIPVVAAGHALAIRAQIRAESLASLPLLMREEGSGTRELVAAMLERRGVVPSQVMYFGHTEALKQAAVSGGGIVWLPRLCMSRELADGSLVPLSIEGLSVQREFSVVHLRNGYLPPPCLAFLAMLHAAAGR